MILEEVQEDSIQKEKEEKIVYVNKRPSSEIYH